MPTYTIEGKRVKTEAPLTEAEIDEIAASIKQEGKPAQEAPKEGITSGFAMGLKDPISAGAQMLPRGLEYVTSLGGATPNIVSKFFGGEAQRVDEMVKAEEQAYQQYRQSQGEEGFDPARLAGNILNPANLAVGGAATRALGATRPWVQAAGTGAVAGAMQPVTSEEPFAEEKLKQTGAGAIGGVLGAAATKQAGRVLNPLVSKAEQTMRELGVTMTPGQMMGKQAKALEEFAQNIPLVGKYISDARERQLFQFNKGIINKALSKVDDAIPDDVIGRDAVSAANDIISSKYDDVLGKIKFTSNPDVQSSLDRVIKTSKLSGAADKQRLNDLINDYIFAKIPVNDKNVGSISGEAYKGIESDILKKVQSLKSSSTDAERSLGEEFGRVLDVMKQFLRSQNPEQSSMLRRIDSAYGDLAVMRTAAANTGAVNGVFTPKQYQSAVRQRDVSRSKSAFAAGKARGQEISEAAMETMNPEVASTVEGRLAMSLGGLYGTMQNPAVAAAATVTAPAMYSERGLKVMEALFRTRPEIAKKIGDILTERATKEGSITGAEIMEEYNKATRTK